MQILHTEQIEGLGIKGRNADETEKLYHKLVRWGWIDGLGRRLTWDYWQRQHARKNRD